MLHSEILASLIFHKNKILFPGLENNHTLKCFLVTFQYSVEEALLKNITVQYSVEEAPLKAVTVQ